MDEWIDGQMNGQMIGDWMMDKWIDGVWRQQGGDVSEGVRWVRWGLGEAVEVK